MAASRVKLACSCAVADGVQRRSVCVALVVGTLLNLINQGDAFFGPAHFSWLKLVLTYLVPYGVCTYGAVAQHLTSLGARDRPMSEK